MPSDQNDSQLSGQVLIRPGVPVANYRLVFTGDHHVSDEDASVLKEARTNVQGEFIIEFGAQRLLDVDVYDENNVFVGLVVLHKLGEAWRVDIALGDSSDDNRHRHDLGRRRSAPLRCGRPAGAMTRPSA